MIAHSCILPSAMACPNPNGHVYDHYTLSMDKYSVYTLLSTT